VSRRYVYDPVRDEVVEVPCPRFAPAPAAVYDDAVGQWKHRPDESTGLTLRNATLEKADRRVSAYKRFDAEARWAE
jgi:hypothetical protein